MGLSSHGNKACVGQIRVISVKSESRRSIEYWKQQTESDTSTTRSLGNCRLLIVAIFFSISTASLMRCLATSQRGDSSSRLRVETTYTQLITTGRYCTIDCLRGRFYEIFSLWGNIPGPTLLSPILQHELILCKPQCHSSWQYTLVHSLSKKHNQERDSRPDNAERNLIRICLYWTFIQCTVSPRIYTRFLPSIFIF